MEEWIMLIYGFIGLCLFIYYFFFAISWRYRYGTSYSLGESCFIAYIWPLALVFYMILIPFLYFATKYEKSK